MLFACALFLRGPSGATARSTRLHSWRDRASCGGPWTTPSAHHTPRVETNPLAQPRGTCSPRTSASWFAGGSTMDWGTLAPVQAILTTQFRCSVPPPPPTPHVMLPQVHGAAGRNKRNAPNSGMSRSVAPPPPSLPSHHPPPSQNQPYSVPPPLTSEGGCGGTHPSPPPRPPRI